MKYLKTLKLAICLALLFSLFFNSNLLSTSVQADAKSTIGYNPPWYVSQVEEEAGMYVSMARNPVSNQLYVAYYNQTSKDLWLARFVGSGGNCGDDSWSCEVVDDGGMFVQDIGQFPSLAFTPDGLPAISYYNVTYHALKYAELKCTLAICTWSLSMIESGGMNTLANSYGRSSSLKIGSDGIPQIAYSFHPLLPGNQALKYAKFVDGNCGPVNTWSCTTIDIGPGIGNYVDMDLTNYVTPLNIPYIAYTEKISGDSNLKYAWYLGNGSGSCGGTQWNCQILDSSGDSGFYPSIRLPSNSQQTVGIAYYDKSTNLVKYAYPRPLGDIWPSACRIAPGVQNSNWHCIGAAQVDYGDEFISLALQNRSDGVAVIGLGFPNIAGWSAGTATHVDFGGDCPGPIDDWECDSIFQSDIAGNEYGKYVDLLLDENDRIQMASFNHQYNGLYVAIQENTVYLPLLVR